MEFEMVTVPPRLVAGYVVRTSNADEMDEQRARLPGLWGRAVGAGDKVAALTDYESDRDGQYTQLVGREIDTIDAAGAGELIAHIPAGSYALFRTTGDLPDSIVDGWRRVWQAEDAGDLRRAWKTDFELWPADGSPQIYVSVQR